MMTIINLILIAIIICFVVDVSGFFTFVKKFVASRLEGKYKNITPEDIKIPFITCSLCSVWWAGLIYLLFVGKFTIPYIAFVAFLSLISSNISSILLLLKDILSTLENLIIKLLKKIY